MNATIEYQEVELDVEFDYQPEEKPIYHYGDGSGYPGCPASIDICLIEFDGRDVTKYFNDRFDEIEELIWEDMQTYCDY